jgi:mannose-6-phosphate isomerase-like protein (cupin superfamily)
VNESVLRLGAVQDEYHWHKHDDDNEFFYVVKGRLLIDLYDRTRATTVELTKYLYPGGVPAHHVIPPLMEL